MALKQHLTEGAGLWRFSTPVPKQGGGGFSGLCVVRDGKIVAAITTMRKTYAPAPESHDHEPAPASQDSAPLVCPHDRPWQGMTPEEREAEWDRRQHRYNQLRAKSGLPLSRALLEDLEARRTPPPELQSSHPSRPTDQN